MSLVEDHRRDGYRRRVQPESDGARPQASDLRRGSRHTERKRIETDLAKARDAAVELVRVKSEFLIRRIERAIKRKELRGAKRKERNGRDGEIRTRDPQTPSLVR